MNRDDIIRMAREAASKFGSWDDWDSDKPAGGPNGNEPHEEREHWIAVVEFIAAAEREACAKVCEELDLYSSYECASAIRARGQA
jgi:hypothetical protein